MGCSSSAANSGVVDLSTTIFRGARRGRPLRGMVGRPVDRLGAKRRAVLLPFHDAPHDYCRFTHYWLRYLFREWECRTESGQEAEETLFILLTTSCISEEYFQQTAPCRLGTLRVVSDGVLSAEATIGRQPLEFAPAHVWVSSHRAKAACRGTINHDRQWKLKNGAPESIPANCNNSCDEHISTPDQSETDRS
jgi:hypothetical protein